MRDFTSFSFGDWHSSDPNTGIVTVYRVSGGDRYDEELHPEIKDRTAEVPGLNGEYYFGSDFGTKTFDIEIAFDSLTEEQFRKLRKVFGTREIKQLVFNERPYKYYMAKLESPIELSYVCFDEPVKVETTIDGIPYKENGITSTSHVVMRVNEQGRTQRIYKGEGKISFVCHFPFAKSVYKQLPLGEEGSSWAVSSGILSATDFALENIDIYNQGIIKVYNPGDIETGFHMYIPFTQTETQITLTYRANQNSTDSDILIFTLPEQGRKNGTGENDKDCGVLIDTNNSLIIGVASDAGDTYITSGNLYNDCIDAGFFFKLQPNELLSDNATITITNGNENIRLYYDYLYF